MWDCNLWYGSSFQMSDGDAVLPEPRERLKMLQYLLSSSLKDLSALKEDDFQVDDDAM